MLFPPSTVTRQLYAESLTAQHSGISNDILLFSETGFSLVHHYRVHRVGWPHAMFRGKYLAQLRALLPANTIMPTAGGPSGPACSPVPAMAGQMDGFGATPQPPGRRRRQGKIMDTPTQIAPRLMEQDPRMAAGAMVFDCRLALLPVSLDVSGINMRAVRPSIPPAKLVVVPPVHEQQFWGRICLVIFVRSWVLLHYWTQEQIWRTSYRRLMLRRWSWATGWLSYLHRWRKMLTWPRCWRNLVPCRRS